MNFFGPFRTTARPRALGALAAFAATAASAAPARADVSSWLSLGFGAASLEGGGREQQPLRFTLPVDLGMGSPPSGAVMVGVGTRVIPYFGDGTAAAAYARAATQGYVVGSWGAAVDAGGFTRLSGEGGPGFIASVNLGVPWGVIVTGSYALGDGGERVASCTVGVDLLRLTVYRLSGEAAWLNPKPAWRPEPAAESAPPR
ncbi:MAG TPA: hypothetical protein VFS43_27375 [Polyangiaceae bacterium]|nr:hypothetical protein [Polyangiaceae bacterium]